MCQRPEFLWWFFFFFFTTRYGCTKGGMPVLTKTRVNRMFPYRKPPHAQQSGWEEALGGWSSPLFLPCWLLTHRSWGNLESQNLTFITRRCQYMRCIFHKLILETKIGGCFYVLRYKQWKCRSLTSLKNPTLYPNATGFRSFMLWGPVVVYFVSGFVFCLR